MSVSGSAPAPIAQLGQPGGDRVDQPVADVADRDGDRDRHAPLAGRAVGRRDRGVGGQVDVGVGQHDHVVLRAAERLHPLAVRRAASRRCSARSGSSRRSSPRRCRGASSSASTASLSPCTTVNTPSGRPACCHSSGEEQRRRRVLLARLEHEGVAAGDRVRAHPQRHHGREVERRDAGDDAERLADRVDVDAGRGLLGEAALEQLRRRRRRTRRSPARGRPRRARRRAPCRARR